MRTQLSKLLFFLFVFTLESPTGACGWGKRSQQSSSKPSTVRKWWWIMSSSLLAAIRCKWDADAVIKGFTLKSSVLQAKGKKASFRKTTFTLAAPILNKALFPIFLWLLRPHRDQYLYANYILWFPIVSQWVLINGI